MPTSEATRDRVGKQRTWDVGDRVLCPRQGLGVVVDRRPRVLFGRASEYLTIEIAQNGTSIMLPTDGPGHAALRPSPTRAQMLAAKRALADPPAALAKDWRIRHKDCQEKLAGGNPRCLAELIRDLDARAATKPLPSGEREMQRAAKDLFVSELVCALALDPDEAAATVESTLRSRNPRSA